MLNNEPIVYDIVVVGAGIAGISHILYLEEFFSSSNIKPTIALISKKTLENCNTYWAQGGIAAVTLSSDNFNEHIKDTLIAGDFLNDENIVEKVVHAAPELIKDLIKWGVDFDKNNQGILDVTREGGHSHNRILHHQDATGKNIQHTLIKNLSRNVHEFENNLLYNISIDMTGAIHLDMIDDKQQRHRIISSHMVLATGGIGMLFENTTNAETATGDGIYLAHLIGLKTSQLSFVQFHPTGLYNPGKKSFLITEALRGEGAILRNNDGESFMQKYDYRIDLAPRDIVSRSIEKEMHANASNHVLLDCTMIEYEKWSKHFPNVYEMCMSIGIDPTNQPIPVIPVQHYLCGGVITNEYGMTDAKNIYAIGEIANTGLHGSNRLASNSLLEGLAFGKFSAQHIAENFIPDWKYESKCTPHINSIQSLDRKFLQKNLSSCMGVIKNQIILTETKNKLLNELCSSTKTEFNYDAIETNMMYTTALLIIEDALKQNNNTGVFFKV